MCGFDARIPVKGCSGADVPGPWLLALEVPCQREANCTSQGEQPKNGGMYLMGNGHGGPEG
jgi:hypothetical protein